MEARHPAQKGVGPCDGPAESSDVVNNLLDNRAKADAVARGMLENGHRETLLRGGVHLDGSVPCALHGSLRLMPAEPKREMNTLR